MCWLKRRVIDLPVSESFQVGETVSRSLSRERKELELLRLIIGGYHVGRQLTPSSERARHPSRQLPVEKRHQTFADIQDQKSGAGG